MQFLPCSRISLLLHSVLCASVFKKHVAASLCEHYLSPAGARACVPCQALGCRLYHVQPPVNHPAYSRLGIPEDVDLTEDELMEIESAQMCRIKSKSRWVGVPKTGAMQHDQLMKVIRGMSPAEAQSTLQTVGEAAAAAAASGQTVVQGLGTLPGGAIPGVAGSLSRYLGGNGSARATITADMAGQLLYDSSITTSRPANLSAFYDSDDETKGGSGGSRGGKLNKRLLFRETIRVRRTPRMDRWASSGGLQGARDMLFSNPAAFAGTGMPANAIGVRRRYGRILASVSARATGERYHAYTLLVSDDTPSIMQRTKPDGELSTIVR
eukprot:COSAG02_NODE_14765_length_1238_cov_1.921861_1_plen_325_part_00